MKVVKDRVRCIKNVRLFEDLLCRLMVSDEDKEILRMIYKERKSFSYIADTLGYSEGTIKRRHRHSLKLIALNIDDITASM